MNEFRERLEMHIRALVQRLPTGWRWASPQGSRYLRRNMQVVRDKSKMNIPFNSSPPPAGPRATAAHKLRLSDLAQLHAQDAVDQLAKEMKAGDSSSSRIAASVALLDRGFGKPPQQLHVEGNLVQEVTYRSVDELQSEVVKRGLPERVIQLLLPPAAIEDEDEYADHPDQTA